MSQKYPYKNPFPKDTHELRVNKDQVRKKIYITLPIPYGQKEARRAHIKKRPVEPISQEEAIEPTIWIEKDGPLCPI
jgi:hypothetical protein